MNSPESEARFPDTEFLIGPRTAESLTMSTTAKQTGKRRTDEQHIADLQAKIDHLQKQVESRSRPDLPVLKEIPKMQNRMRKFAQLAINYGRADLANSTMAFVAGLDRTLNESGLPRRRGRTFEEAPSS